MNNVELIGYLLVFALSVFWSGFAINRKSSIFSFLSSITWHTLAVLQFYLAYSGVMLALTWMFFGIGMFFLVLGIAWAITNFLVTRKNREMELI